MTTPTAPKAKMRHCPYCGDEMGIIEKRFYCREDPCGKPECDREAREAAAQEREDAHRDLDDRMGWS